MASSTGIGVSAPSETTTEANAAPVVGSRRDLKPRAPIQPIPISPSRSPYVTNMAVSPSRLRSASPGRHSPASSEIFERNVQEPVQIAQLQGELSPAHIPSHVITEDHIPPALEASVQAITSEELNPDQVEIVTSSSHQPAASALEPSASQADLSQMGNAPLSPLQHIRSEDSEAASSMHQSGILPLPGEEDTASNYGSLDPTDVRRLSFISFADVVQSEHLAPASAVSDAGHRDSLHISSLPSSYSHNRAASPLRSPRSTTSASGGVTTPPLAGGNITSNSLEQSPPPSLAMGSPLSQSHSELTIETMRQAVRKTASGDLSGGRSVGMSPVSDENLADLPRSRQNS